MHPPPPTAKMRRGGDASPADSGAHASARLHGGGSRGQLVFVEKMLRCLKPDPSKVHKLCTVAFNNMILPFSVVSWRGARPDARMHPLRCRLVLHPPPPPCWHGGGRVCCS